MISVVATLKTTEIYIGYVKDKGSIKKKDILFFVNKVLAVHDQVLQVYILLNYFICFNPKQSKIMIVLYEFFQKERTIPGCVVVLDLDLIEVHKNMQ